MALLAVAGCGGGRGVYSDERAVLVLDAPPAGHHAGIYLARQRRFDEPEGVTLRIRRPRRPGDGVRLLSAGRAELAVLDVHDLALARRQGADVVGVMALVQQPLAALLSRPGARAGRAARVGLPGRPWEPALLRALAGGRGRLRGARLRRVGFGGVPAMLDGRLDHLLGSWPVEGTRLRLRRAGTRERRLYPRGAPAFPQLVLAATRGMLADRRPTVRAAVRALQRGYEEAIVDPESAVGAVVGAAPRAERDTVAAQLEAVAPALTAGVRDFGRLDAGRLAAWSRWAADAGILERRLDIRRAFDFSLAGPVSRD